MGEAIRDEREVYVKWLGRQMRRARQRRYEQKFYAAKRAEMVAELAAVIAAHESPEAAAEALIADHWTQVGFTDDCLEAVHHA